MYSQFDPYSINIDAIKEYFKRKRVLAAGVFYLLCVFASLAYTVVFYVKALSSSDSISPVLGSVKITGATGSSYYYDAAQSTLLFSMIPVIVGLVINLVFAIGYILMNKKSKSETGSPKKASTLLFVVSIIFLAAIGLPCLLAAFGAVILLTSASVAGIMDYAGFRVDYSMYAVVAIAVIATVIIIILHAVFELIYHNSIRRSMRSIELRCSGAKAFGVMNIIFAVLYGALLVISAVNSFKTIGASDSTSVVLNILSLITYALALVRTCLIAATALGYNKYIKDIRSGYNGASYQGLGDDVYSSAPVSTQPSFEQNTSAAVDMGRNPYSDLFSAQPAPAVTSTPAPESFEDLFTDSAPDQSAEDTAPEQTARVEESADNAQPSSAAPITCPSCGSSLPADSVFCNRCGTRL